LEGVSSPRGVINSRGQVSFIRPASPNKVSNAVPTSSSSRGLSPVRLRSGASYNGFNSQPSILSFAADVKRGRVGENRIVEAHSLRLLHNRLLQWRFVNARADSDLSLQKSNAEVSFHFKTYIVIASTESHLEVTLIK